MASVEIAPRHTLHQPVQRASTIALMLALAVVACGLAYSSADRATVILSASTGGALLCIALLGLFSKGRERSKARKAQSAVDAFLKHDASACFVTDEVGAVWYRNASADRRFNAGGDTMVSTLAQTLSNPASVVSRLTKIAEQTGGGCEDVVTRQGHIRVSCNALSDGGKLWRIEPLSSPAPPDVSRSFEKLPLVTVGRNDTILYMNEMARHFVGERAKALDRIFPELPVKIGQIQSVSTAEGNVPCVVAELKGQAGRREIVLVPTSQKHVEIPENMRFFDELPVPLLKLSSDGRVASSNRMARALLSRDKPEGECLSKLLEGLGRSIKDWLRDTIEGRAHQQSEFLKVRRSDSETFVQVILKPAVEDGKNVLVAVLNDATELKTLEAQFVQSQKMQAIGQLAGGVAHDFNNLLTAISGHCDLLMLRCDEQDKDFADLEQISQNANRAAALVSQLLAFSRKQTLRPKTIEVQETLSDLTHLLNRLVGERVHLDFEHVTGSNKIRADKRQIEQVVMNLVVNARDAMPAGGKVTIQTETMRIEQPLKRDRARVPPGAYVAVKVKDEGAGIAPDKLQKIFEPFFTTKRTGEGTGLGLSTAYGIVKQTGGFIFADSELGKGSCFTLIFPLYDGLDALDESQRTPHRKAENIGRCDGSILLVEDEAPVRAFASRALSLSGYRILEASSGEEALEILNDDAVAVEAFVTDVVMPGLDGPSWVREALLKRPNTKVVFMSGYAEDVFSEGGSEVTHSVFLQKPFSLAELTSTVQDLLRHDEVAN